MGPAGHAEAAGAKSRRATPAIQRSNRKSWAQLMKEFGKPPGRLSSPSAVQMPILFARSLPPCVGPPLPMCLTPMT